MIQLIVQQFAKIMLRYKKYTLSILIYFISFYFANAQNEIVEKEMIVMKEVCNNSIPNLCFGEGGSTIKPIYGLIEYQKGCNVRGLYQKGFFSDASICKKTPQLIDFFEKNGDKNFILSMWLVDSLFKKSSKNTFFIKSGKLKRAKNSYKRGRYYYELYKVKLKYIYCGIEDIYFPKLTENRIVKIEEILVKYHIILSISSVLPVDNL